MHFGEEEEARVPFWATMTVVLIAVALLAWAAITLNGQTLRHVIPGTCAKDEQIIAAFEYCTEAEENCRVTYQDTITYHNSLDEYERLNCKEVLK